MLRNIVIVILSFALLACSEPDRQSRLQQSIDDLVEAINDHDAGEALSFVSPNATWRPGWDADRAHKSLFFYFRRYPTIKVSLSNEEIRWISDNEAILTATAYTLGVSGQRLDVRGNRYQIELRWFFNDGDWRITRMNWQ